MLTQFLVILCCFFATKKSHQQKFYTSRLLILKIPTLSNSYPVQPLLLQYYLFPHPLHTFQHRFGTLLSNTTAFFTFPSHEQRIPSQHKWKKNKTVGGRWKRRSWERLCSGLLTHPMHLSKMGGGSALRRGRPQPLHFSHANPQFSSWSPPPNSILFRPCWALRVRVMRRLVWVRIVHAFGRRRYAFFPFDLHLIDFLWDLGPVLVGIWRVDFGLLCCCDCLGWNW